MQHHEQWRQQVKKGNNNWNNYIQSKNGTLSKFTAATIRPEATVATMRCKTCLTDMERTTRLFLADAQRAPKTHGEKKWSHGVPEYWTVFRIKFQHQGQVQIPNLILRLCTNVWIWQPYNPPLSYSRWVSQEKRVWQCDGGLRCKGIKSLPSAVLCRMRTSQSFAGTEG